MRMAKVPFFRFDFISTASWFFASALGTLGLVVYPSAIRFETVIFIILCHGALLAGFYLVRHRQQLPAAPRAEDLSFKTLAFFAALFVVVSIGVSAIEGNIPLVDSLSSLEMNRQKHWNEEKSFTGWLVQMLSFTAIPFSLLIAVFPRSRYHYILWLFTVLFIAEASFLAGARSIVVYLCVGAAAILMTFRRVRFTRTAVLTALGMFLVYMLASQFYLQRNSRFERNPNVYIERSCHGGRLSESMRNAPISAKALTLSSCYFTGPVRALDNMMQRWDKMYYGGYNLGVIFEGQFTGARDDIEDYFLLQSSNGNPWATSIRDVWLDVRWGAPLAFCFLGFLFALATSRRRGSYTTTDVARFGLLAVAGFTVPFVSPLVVRHFLYPFVFTYLIDAFVSTVARRRDAARHVDAGVSPHQVPAPRFRGT
jgi:hypothetical protein